MIKAALPNVRMTLIQPSPYDDVTRAPSFEGGYNTVLVRYAQFIKELVQRSGLDVADLNKQVVAALEITSGGKAVAAAKRADGAVEFKTAAGRTYVLAAAPHGTARVPRAKY